VVGQGVLGSRSIALFYRVATLGKLFTDIASPVFSAPRNWGYKREYSDWTALVA